KGDVEVKNQVTWWPGRKEDVAFAGYTQDATKHLKKLAELELINLTSSIAKPEYLLDRLLSIFTEQGDVVLECFVSTGDMAAVCLKRDRHFIHLQGSSARDEELLVGCVVPRLQAVINGQDHDLENKDSPKSPTKVRQDYYIPFEGGGGFKLCRVGEWLFRRRLEEDIATLNLDAYSSPDRFIAAMLTAEGYLPIEGQSNAGLSLDGSRRCVVVGPDEFLTPDLASDVALQANGIHTTVYYFRASEDFNPALAPDQLYYRRVPVDLVV
ncbi:MAG: site-specific DNA-methyltransferase, partial [Fimbriimonadaceae bacterium]|nr:site-specific DNA-methyltransferase [Fimbriimonadaceae bacterium]